MKTKRCSRCGIIKEISEFNKERKSKSGLRSDCKACEKQYYQDHKMEKAAYRQTDAGKDAARKGSQKRRALKLNATVEDFSPAKILERDGYICQHCGRKTRPDYKNSFHPLYPNLDHIVPLSKGGEHSKRNTQCLCRQCNTRKHNDIKGQVRLFG